MIPPQSVDTSFFTSEKHRMTNQLASPAQRDYFYLDPFWCVNLGTYIIKCVTRVQHDSFPLLRTVPTNSKVFLRALLTMREKQILTSDI